MGNTYDEFLLGAGMSTNELTDANNECREHGRVPFEGSPPCGCFPIEKGGPVAVLPVRQQVSRKAVA